MPELCVDAFRDEVRMVFQEIRRQQEEVNQHMEIFLRRWSFTTVEIRRQQEEVNQHMEIFFASLEFHHSGV